MNRYGNLHRESAQLYQVTAQLSCVRNGWNSSRQLATVMMVGDDAVDVVKRLGDIAWLSDDSSTERRITATVAAWDTGTMYDVTVTCNDSGYGYSGTARVIQEGERA